MKSLFSKQGRGFTMVELLVVVIIIAILVGLTLSIVGNVTNSARKSRAAGEVAAIELALGRFQVDNGFYPTTTAVGTATVPTTSITIYNTDPSSTAATNRYKVAGRALFLALTGRTMYNATNGGTNTNNYRQYYTDLKAGQVGDAGISNTSSIVLDPTSAGTYTNTNTSFNAGSYIMDPYQYPYGYFYAAAGFDAAGDLSVYNRTAPDIWSTAGENEATNKTTNIYLIQRWVHNWPQNASQ